MFARITLISCLLVALGACGTETGNPELLEFEYNATTTDPARVGLRADAGFSVEAVWLRLADVSFTDCDGVERGTLTGIGLADHGGEEAALQALELPDVPYCGIATALFPEPDATDEPERVAGSAISLSGRLSDGRAWFLTVHRGIPLDIALDGASLPEDSAWLLAFDLATWLDPEALDALPGDPLVLTEASHPALIDAFVARLPAGLLVHEDRNGNGRIDEDEPGLNAP
jgi:hypothetical protein